MDEQADVDDSGVARWRRVDGLVKAALDRPAAGRGRFLDSACDGDASLRREVESLLAVDGEAEGFLERPAGLAGPAEPAAGHRIGPYRIEREIGAGGMGVVYLAARADDVYRGQVAIKVLQPGAASAALARRFQGERQILASLDHPSIARLLDGGTTAGGRPYLVMEYIDGLPVDEYCDAHRLTVRQRLELFRKVCAAVHYAHQNLVVHRDLKPSNILVTAEGEPRLLDFGIAKLLDPEQFPITVEATTAGLRPMTPHYASPEQVRGGAITTASDVYSLGVLLYRLLTGRLPHRLTGRSVAEIERIVHHEEPLKPSSTVADGGDRATDVEATERAARCRGVRPQQLRRQLEGDLDHVVGKALRAEPAGRYGSAEQLADDLGRHLEGLPVAARQGAFGYQLAKFLRRNRLAVAVAGAILTLVVAFALTMARQAALTARQRDLAEQERQQAQEQRQRAEQVSEFVIDLLQGFDPWQGGGKITPRQLLERGVEKIEGELQDQPEVRAKLQMAIGDVYFQLGLHEQAEPLFEAALATRESLLGPDHLDVAESLAHLAVARFGGDDYADTEPMLRRALAIREQALGPDHHEIAVVLRYLASQQRRQGRYAEADAAGRRALAILRRGPDPDHVEILRTLVTLAASSASQGRLSEAQGLLEEALAAGEAAPGENDAEIAWVRYNLGLTRLDRGAPAEAQSHIERALAVFREELGEEHPRVATAHLALADVARERDRPAVEEGHLERALALFSATMGDDHPYVSTCLLELGRLRLRAGRLREASPLLERALEIRERSYGRDHPWTASCLVELVEVARLEGRIDESAALCRRLRDLGERHPGDSAFEQVPRVCGETP